MLDAPAYLPYLLPFMISVLLFTLFCYLYRIHRLRFLAIWATAWAFWSIRIGYGMLLDDMQFGRAGFILIGLSVSYNTLILVGAAELSGKQVLKIWLPLILSAVVIRAIASPLGYEILGMAVFLLVLGSSWVWAGLLFASSDKEIGPERWIAAIPLIAQGFNQWLVPVYQQYPTFVPWTTNITALLQLGIALGVLVVFNRQYRMNLMESHKAHEESLTKVLSGYIPICAYCHSIRDDQSNWHRLEAYISQRTDAQLSHGICPNCKSDLHSKLKRA